MTATSTISPEIVRRARLLVRMREDGRLAALRPIADQQLARLIPLARRPLLRRLMARLVVGRRESPGTGIGVQELVEAGWPGEQMHPHSAASRVYVAISTLRKLGLAEVIQRDENGYRLDPRLSIAPATG